MPTRSSSLGNNVSTAVDREIGSQYDDVRVVAENIESVVTVADHIDNVDTVATNIVDMHAVGGSIVDVRTVAADINNVVVVGQDIANVNTVAANVGNIDRIVAEVIPNIDEILLADDNATIATTKAAEASTSAANALVSEQNAKTSELSAAASEGTATIKAAEASASAISADADATIATTQANLAIASMNAAKVSADNALVSANNATAQAGIAATKASEASASAISAGAHANLAIASMNAAKVSEDSALVSASNATAQAGIAATKASEASASAIAAYNSELAAHNSELSAAAMLDAFDDRYIGSYVENPVLDNDGQPLIDGALYFNTSINALKVYDLGTAMWLTIPQVKLSRLSDVQLTSIATGNVLKWDGTEWVNTNEFSNHIVDANNPHYVTKSQVGLSNVDNTSDATKNVLSATKLTTARAISLTGDVTGTVNFDGSADVSIAAVVADDSHLHSFANLTSKPTTLSGYGITDAYTKTESDTAFSLKANLASPTLTGIPIAPTAAVGTNTTQLATTAFVKAEIANDTYSKADVDAKVVHKTGNETIAGVKTFSSSPIVPTPTAPTEVANKAYVDTKQANLGFTPVQQGTGIGQLGNAVKIGWSPEYRLKVTVDATDIGNIVTDIDGTIAGVKTFTSSPIVPNATTATQAIAYGQAVKLTGNETIAGVKTFTSSPIVPTPILGGAAVNKDYVDNEILQATSTEVYSGPYGLNWDETNDVYIRTGSTNYKAIQSLMRRCVMNDNGTVNYYLHPYNSNYKADGTVADLTGASGNVMVEVPKFYYKYNYNTTGGVVVHEHSISLIQLDGYTVHDAFVRGGVEMANRYYPAYLGYSTGSKLLSRSGVYPTVGLTRAQFRTLARANGTGWEQIDFLLYEAITLLMVIEYGTMNIQSALGQGRTALTGGTWTGGSIIGINGLSNGVGNGTANVTYAGSADDAAADGSFMTYRGCENFFGNIWRFVDGINCNGSNSKLVYLNMNPATYADSVITGDYVSVGVTSAAASGFARKLGNTRKGFIPTDITGGTSANGTTDYYYTSTTVDTLALVGGNANAGLAAGPLHLDVGTAPSLSGVHVGAGVSR